MFLNIKEKLRPALKPPGGAAPGAVSAAAKAPGCRCWGLVFPDWLRFRCLTWRRGLLLWPQLPAQQDPFNLIGCSCFSQKLDVQVLHQRGNI